MIDRTQRVLLIVLAVQVVVLVLMTAPWSRETDAAADTVLFPNLDPGAVARIEIEDDDGTVTLARGPDGWAVDELDGFAAEADKVAGLLDEIAAAEVGPPVVRSDRYHATLGVADGAFEARVSLRAAEDDAVLADVLLGTSPNVGLRHVRRAEDDLVYEVDGFERWRLRGDAATWIEKAVFPDLEAAAVRQVRITRPAGELVLVRGEDGAWVVDTDAAGTFADGSAEAARRVDDLVGLQLTEPAGEDAPRFNDADAEATLELSVEADEGATRTVVLLVGPKLAEDDDRRVVRRTDRPRDVVLGSYDAERILDGDA